MAYEELIGPKAHEREGGVRDEQLKDGSPLYHVLLHDQDAPFVSKDEVQSAKSELARLRNIAPEIVKSCDGKTPEEARKILDSIRLLEKRAA